MRLVRVLVILALGLVLTLAAPAADLDRDTLDDKLEQRLLRQFRPTLLIDAHDCDQRPAEFRDGKPGARNGALYGQVFRNSTNIEIHYYHLWTHDCGRGAHPGDAEHVAVLLEPAGRDWKAVAWIAAGHDGTLCDRRHGALAATIGATTRGATVWVSYGKHASFLSQQACGGGCGGDRCDRPVTLAPGKLFNVGEAATPMPGFDWIRRPAAGIHLTEKMSAEFTTANLKALRYAGPQLVALSPVPAPAQAVVLGGNHALNGMATGGRHTDAALNTAASHVDRALSTSYERVRGSVQRARRWWKR